MTVGCVNQKIKTDVRSDFRWIYNWIYDVFISHLWHGFFTALFFRPELLLTSSGVRVLPDCGKMLINHVCIVTSTGSMFV